MTWVLLISGRKLIEIEEDSEQAVNKLIVLNTF